MDRYFRPIGGGEQQQQSMQHQQQSMQQQQPPPPAVADDERLHELLQAHWGYRAFRGPQLDVIRAALGGRDSLVVMATGGGKSLCYQVWCWSGWGASVACLFYTHACTRAMQNNNQPPFPPR